MILTCDCGYFSVFFSPSLIAQAMHGLYILIHFSKNQFLNVFISSNTFLFSDSLIFFLNFGFIYLFFYFIYGCVGSSFLCEGFLQLRQVGATLHCGARASHYCSLSCCGAQAPDAQAQQLCSRAQLLRGMWDLPRPGLEPVSPALAGRFSTTAPPGKP